MTRAFVLLLVPVAMMLYSILTILNEVLWRLVGLLDDARGWLRKQISAATRSQM